MREGDIKNTVNRLSKHNDIVLAGMVVAIIALIILPIPPALVDSMIVLNMATSVGLLMLSLYIPSALSLSTFPTLLLFTTLFRLALNITTTRQILLHANAGKIIYTFGNLVVGGNFVVGGVVFII
ncbi:MAG: FHIPEP family type III secretion protein, partial [Desulfobacteraceae bacterium]